jgi:uncharacterized protein with NRDE domain
MCLLIVVSRVYPQVPLVVGANRDEMLDRPATPMTLLHDAEPRILGGRDEERGGTWLAVNDHGVVAGLTNRPPSAAGDPMRKSRGELPLALARHRSAASAVEAFGGRYRPSDYNPAWLLVGDRDSLFAVDMTDGDEVGVTELPPGVHVLENWPFGIPSAKVARARTVVGDPEAIGANALMARIQTHLGDHEVPRSLENPEQADARGTFSAACVHADGFGTRWSAVIAVPPARNERPRFRYADGPPCRTPFVDAGSRW